MYSIPCNNCNLIYVGHTKQYLKERLRQHEYDCRGINVGKLESMALAKHHFDTGHIFDFQNFVVLDRKNNLRSRTLSEMMFINTNSSVNFRSDVDGLSSVTIFKNLEKEQVVD